MTENDSTPSQSRDSDSDAADAQPNHSRAEKAGALRLAGLGTELAGITLALMGIGYVVDSVRGHDTGYATAFGTLVGFTMGMTRFILQVRKINED